MDVLVWIMTGIAIWHFAVFVPDRFWGGIVGAFGAAIIGAVFVGLIVQLVTGASIDDPNLGTMMEAVVGAAIALGASYRIGISRGEEPIPDMQE